MDGMSYTVNGTTYMAAVDPKAKLEMGGKGPKYIVIVPMAVDDDIVLGLFRDREDAAACALTTIATTYIMQTD